MTYEALNTSLPKKIDPPQTHQGQNADLQQKKIKPNPPSLLIQPELTVGAPDDPYEREADEVANRVMRMSEPGFVQLKCHDCEEESVRRKAEEEDEPLQLKRTFLQAKSDSGARVSAPMAGAIQASRGKGASMDPDTHSFMSRRFGRDFSTVNIHTDNRAAQLNQDLNARAFTAGRDIYFNQGQYNPRSDEGRHLLAHELTHVLQQKGNELSNGDGINRSPETELIQRSTTTFVEGAIRGHASPRWEQRRGRSREELNLQLSRERADAVEYLFKEMLRHEMEGNVRFSITCTSEDHRDPETISIPAEAVGESQTIVEAGGNVRANDPSMRRVDINVVVTKQTEGLAGYTESVVIPEACEEHATNRWAIKMALGGGAGHAGLGGAFAIGQLKNRRTGQIAQGSFLGGGIGVGLQTPGADPGWGDWTNFTTEDVCTFADFDNTLARLTTAGAGIAIIGYSLAWISFPMRGANSIYVGGFNMGSLGADAGSNVGNWNIHGTPPGPRCTPEHTVAREGFAPYQFDTLDPLQHRVYFDTGSSQITDEQFDLLHEFVDHIASRYSEVR